ncbi:MAG TPA: autotransporter-associated beta strand repeat-containing protein [Verrucomicrobiae bacterium]
MTTPRTDRLPSRMFSKLIVSALCLTGASAFAATEQWLGVPGTSATTNWTDAANWTASVDQTYYNQVQFNGTGASANTDFSINNVLDATTGVSQMPIWRLDFFPLNGNYTTLINPGVTLTLGAGYGDLIVGADAQNTGSAAPANAFETITFTGAGGALSMGGSLTVGQGSTTPADTHNVTLDLSGLDNFTMDSSSGGSRGLYLASGGFQRGNGLIYFAKTNQISITDTLRIVNLDSTSNSLPSGIYLGSANTMVFGADLLVGGNGAVAGGFMKFNPAVIGGATAPSADLHGSNGRIAHLLIGSGNGGAQVPSLGTLDLTGGTVSLMVDTMQLGVAGTANAAGTLTFGNGTANVNNANIGNQAASSGGTGVGVVNVNTNGTLQVNQTLTLAAVTGTVTPGTAGTINLNGGTLSANTIVNGSGTGTIAATSGNLTVATTASFSNLNFTNSALSLTLASGVTNVTVAGLTTGGATNVINILAAPPYASYPVQIPLVKYASLNGAGFNIGLGSLPALYAGHLVNNTTSGSIDVVFTSGAAKLVWNGNINNNWDTTTANWIAGGAAVYANGQLAQFFDGAVSSTVNLTATLIPSGLIVSNSAQNFTFNGTGALSGLTGLAKSGSGALIIDNSGSNDFSGGVTINGGSVQVGNNDANGNLPAGNVVNNGSLTIARSDSQTLNNTISGSGSLTQSGGTLLLSGNNSYTGNTLVTNSGTLKMGSGSALGGGGGSTIIANGSTLDINGNYQNKPLVISGTGASGTGALVNNGGDVYGFASQITLTGDTTFNYSGRSDLVNATIGTGGNPYNLTISSGYFEWQNVTADSALANINYLSGSWGWKNLTPTSFGNPAGLLTLSANTTVTLWSPSVVNKNMDLQGGLIVAYSGGNVMSGNMTLEDGFSKFQMNGGCSLTLSNTLSGSANATLYVVNGDGTLTLAGNSPNFLGNLYLNRGVVVLDGSIGGIVTTLSDTTFAGHGSASGLVDLDGALYPGNSGVVGTFTAGGLTLESDATLTMDLSSSTASGNDAVQVNGDLTINGNNIIINPINNTLANGTYPLISYTGNFIGSIGAATTTYATAYTLTLTNDTVAKKIELIVSGSLNSSLLIWNNANSSGQWDIGSSATWSNVTTHAASSVFYALDSVVLDDSILTAATPVTNINITTTVVPAVITNNSSVSYTLSGTGKISGSGGLVKQGSGTLSLNVPGNFTGPVIIGGGTVKTVGNNTLGSVSSITINNGGTFDFAGNAYNSTNPITISGTGVNGAGTIINSGGTFYDALLNIVLANDALVAGNPNGRWDITYGSLISGAHTLTINMNGGYGEIKTPTIAANVIGLTITNGQAGMQNMQTSCLNPATLLTVEPNGTAIIWSGGFNGSVYMMPGSTFDLYSGNTFALASGATLSGSGTITGNSVTVGAGATISPSGTSAATTGTLKVDNLILNGTIILKLNGSGTNDAITTGGGINFGGTLTLTNIGPALVAGNSFQLFSAVYGLNGTFGTINLPALSSGLVWDLSQLNNGLVQVVTAAGPVISTTTVVNGQLIFGGSGGTAGNSYVVLTATNLINPQWVPIATNTYATGGTFSVTNTISGSTPQLFYRTVSAQ